MTWTAYQVSFRLLAPLHIGWRKLGNLQQTRPYMTGRNLWGSLTARLTREQGSNDYKGIGGKVDKQLAFTYFYPSTERDANAVTLWPWADEWDKFAWTFLGSYASTALKNGRSAEAGSLHETEFIAPHTRDNEPKQVYLVGYIFKKDSCNLDDRRDVLNKLQFGGERGYGWGRVQLEGHPVACRAVDTCFGYKLSCENEYPMITVPQGGKLLAHTVASNDTPIVGTIEPFLGRETRKDNNKGFGGSFSEPMPCWVPGSEVSKEQTFQIGEKGIWR